MQKLDSKKACQETNVLVKLVKENLDNIPPFVYSNFINSLFSSYFHAELKNANVTGLLVMIEKW